MGVIDFEQKSQVHISTWSDLEVSCPANIDNIKLHYLRFVSKFSFFKTGAIYSDRAKESLLESAGEVRAMITSLSQLLSGPSLIRNTQDMLTFSLFRNHLSNLYEFINSRERDIVLDKEKYKIVTPAHISSFSTFLREIADTVFDCLSKTTKDFFSPEFEETEEIKRDRRTFLYMLFNNVFSAFSVIAGYMNMWKGASAKTLPTKADVMNLPIQYMMNGDAYEKIKDSYTEISGRQAPNENIDFTKYFYDPSKAEEGNYYEEVEEDESDVQDS